MLAKNLDVSCSSVRQVAQDILVRVERGREYADALLARALHKHALPAKDRALLLELVNGTLRWRGQLDWILRRFFRGDFDAAPLSLKTILRLGMYQLRFLDRVPDYAVVSEAVSQAKRAGNPRWASLVNGVLRTYLREADKLTFPSLKDDAVAALAVQHSHPEWMLSRWVARFGVEDTLQLCKFNNSRPAVTLRVNPQKTDRDTLARRLRELGFAPKPAAYFPDFIRVEKAQGLTETDAFKQGWFTIQDESTALATSMLQPRAGETVVDLCAAPGGKTCHVASLMRDRGTILAVDVRADRLTLLRENAKRLGLRSVQLVRADGRNVCVRGADRVLVDAPCSGLGVLARRVDLRWKRRPEEITNVRSVQLALLRNAISLLRVGGVLVYSTCTIEPEENEELVSAFLAEQKNVEMDAPPQEIHRTFVSNEGWVRTLPFVHKMDGGFAVRLVKTG
ncbi:MAG: 16S rRNA (cytosine(967)-C(5))-methyltransferase RsmB [Calditrichaeota bacterium]|nr:MAG: 16S rRNA (cytosine(967)-C(5))-methyltransferase RsmB [Calditrichota bacterium]